MTRSVEIPDVAAWAARQAYASAPVRSDAMRAAIAAALPYLAPAGEPCPLADLDNRCIQFGDPPPAVPQPVDREALATALKIAAGRATQVGGATFIEGTANDFADAVLAVLAGEQEQVESPE